MAKKYIVTLTAEERATLGQMVSSGKGAARRLTRARILLKADASAGCPAWKDEQIVEALDVGIATVERLRRQFVEEGFEAALSEGRAMSMKPLPVRTPSVALSDAFMVTADNRRTVTSVGPTV